MSYGQIQTLDLIFLFFFFLKLSNDYRTLLKKLCFSLSYMLFNIIPVIVDIIVAVVFFITAFNAYFGLIVFVTMGLYLGKCCYYAAVDEQIR